MSHEPTGARSRGERGIALLAVLWLVTLLSVVAASFGATSRTEIQLARNAVEKARAEALADAGVYRAVLALMEPDPDARWRTDGTVYAFPFGDGRLRVAIQDEAGRVDLNVAADELLRGLFLYAGLDEPGADALLDALADFRDPDDLRRPNGAEDADYRAAGLPYGAKDGPFEVVEELQQVLGMTPELYRRIAPLVTVYSWQDGVDPMTAPPAVLLALPGTDPAEVEAFLTWRDALPEGLDPTAAAGAAPNGPMGGVLAQPQSLEQSGERSRAARVTHDPVTTGPPPLTGGERYLSWRASSTYTIRAEGRTASGTVFVRETIASVAPTDGADPAYLFYVWRRGEADSGDVNSGASE